MNESELSRRRFMQQTAGAALTAGAVSTGLVDVADAAPSTASPPSASRHQIDARTLVVVEDMVGETWLYIDPAVIYEGHPAAASNLVFECLYHVPDGKKLTGFQPLLAEAMPDVSADGLTATIKLKQGIRFHNSGNLFTAADVLFSWGRLNTLQGNPAFLYADNIASVEAVDDFTLQLTLKAPNAALVAILSAVPMAVTDSKVLREHGGVSALGTPVVPGGPLDPVTAWFNEGNSAGTGPFRLTAWDPANSIILEAVPDYWGEKPQLDRVIFRNVQSLSTQIQLIQTGDADLAFSLDPDSTELVASDPSLQVLEGPSLAFEYIALHTDPTIGGPLSHKQVRQAIAYAIDYDGFIHGLLRGAAVHPATMVPLGMLGAEEVLPLAYTLDLTKAQQLYDASGVGEQEITLTWGAGQIARGGVSRDIAAAKYKSDIEKIKGLNVKLNPLDPTRRQTEYRKGTLQSVISEWEPDYPDVHTYAQPFGHTGGITAKRVGYSNPEVDALLDAGIAEQDPERRKRDYVEVQERLIEDVPFLAIYQPTFRMPASARVKGVQPHGLYVMQLRFASKTE